MDQTVCVSSPAVQGALLASSSVDEQGRSVFCGGARQRREHGGNAFCGRILQSRARGLKSTVGIVTEARERAIWERSG